jgi:hypothetical protein
MSLETVNFWLNAFIPNSACTQKGDLFVVTAPDGRFFAGDQREFSDGVNESARMHSEVRIENLSSDNPTIAFQNNVCGETQQIDN